MKDNIIKILNEIQTTIVVQKNHYNKFGNFKYRKLEDIFEALKPILRSIEEKPVITCSDEIVNIGKRYYIKATVSLLVGDQVISNTALARESKSKKGMDDCQITGCASTYARKVALSGLLGLDDIQDSDDPGNQKYTDSYNQRGEENQQVTTPKNIEEDLADIKSCKTIAELQSVYSTSFKKWANYPEKLKLLQKQKDIMKDLINKKEANNEHQ